MNSQSSDQAFAQVSEAHGYQLIRKIGSGGFGNIFLVESTKYNVEFAIKRIFCSKFTTSEPEIQALMKLSHPGVIRIFDYFKDEQYIYLVLEYCPYGSFKDMITKNGPLELKTLLSTCLDITKALEFCHNKKVSHLDIKPSNIFIDKYGRPTIADFGLSQEMLDLQAKTTCFDGSLCFQSPQVILCEPYNPFKADVWSLGCTFYYFATGSLPFASDNPERLTFLIESGLYNIPATVNKDFAYLIKEMLTVPEESRPSMSRIKSYLMNMMYDKQTALAPNPKPIQTKIRTFATEQRRFSTLSKCARSSIISHNKSSRIIHVSSPLFNE